ncbi:hypothetical protein DSO57_1002643 [Entomophthora muscae]|uniref:Uncharacterized protein n=1 Tax=Entomophthora muscae TaxID=34485 RepID=A0ACC2TJX3_9FUNG|nr:hypothetical protein DSO57_1002643 [Entomophthora muscae]
MKLMVFSWILVYIAASEVALSSDPQELELYNDYCFEQQSIIDALFRPLETFPRILDKAVKMLYSNKNELVMYSKSVLVTMLSRMNDIHKSPLAAHLLYRDSLHSYGVDSIRKLYFDQLRKVELIKQTAQSKAFEVMLVHSRDVDFFKHFIHHQKTLTQIDSQTMASIRNINKAYIQLLSKLDTFCQKEEALLMKFHNFSP